MPSRRDSRPGQQQLVRRSWKIAALACGSDHPRLTVDTYADGNAATRLRAATDVAKDLLSWELSARGAVNFEPFRKSLPRVAASDLDCFSAIRVAQAHERKVELQQFGELVGKPSRHGKRIPPGPDGRDR
jgi:hypothetical protein